MVDWTKIVTNVYHAGMILGSAYIAAHPADYGWLIVAMQALGQSAPPPDWTPGLRLPEVPRA
jgi:hypothetical protein